MEYRKKCNVCGKIYCFSDKDLSENTTNSAMAAVSAVGAIASIFGGTRLDTYALNNQGDRYSSKVVDYNKCPFCNSSDTSLLTAEEWLKATKTEDSQESTNIAPKRIEINANATEESLLKRISMFLEDEEWESAAAYCEQVLDINPECSFAYIYKLMNQLHIKKLEDLAFLSEPFGNEKLYEKAIRYADDNLKATLEGYNNGIVLRNNKKAYDEAITIFQSATTVEECIKAYQLFNQLGNFEDAKSKILECNIKASEIKYKNAADLEKSARTEEEYLNAKAKYDELGDYADAKTLSEECRKKAEEARKNAIYNDALLAIGQDDIEAVAGAVAGFETISGWKDSDARCNEAKRKLEQLESAKEKHDKKRKGKIVAGIICSVLGIVAITVLLIIAKNNYRRSKYEEGLACLNNKQYSKAIECFNQGDGVEVEKYISYCEVAMDVQNIPDRMYLADLVAEIEALNNFNNADLLIEDIPHIDGIRSKMDSWWKTELDFVYGGRHNYIRISNNYKLLERWYEKGEMTDEYETDIPWSSEKQCWRNGIESSEWFNDPNYSDTLYTKVANPN